MPTDTMPTDVPRWVRVSEHEGSAFRMPAVDQPASTETGVILAGLDTERLLAGLGVATLADDPTSVTLLVDQLRHGGTLAIDTAIDIGARRWRAVRPALAEAGHGMPMSASIRQAWDRALRVVHAADLGPLGPAGPAYLAACWLRRDNVDERVALLLPADAARPAATAPRPEQSRQQEGDRVVSEVAT
jgi:hypothetical protein